MEANELEKSVVGRLLSDPELKPVRPSVDFEKVRVADREFTGGGFLTEFEQSQELKLFEDGVSLRWGKVGARLNASKLETGYVVYIDNGYLTTVEGYTYGDEWPDSIDSIDLYVLKLGMDLGGDVPG